MNLFYLIKTKFETSALWYRLKSKNVKFSDALIEIRRGCCHWNNCPPMFTPPLLLCEKSWGKVKLNLSSLTFLNLAFYSVLIQVGLRLAISLKAHTCYVSIWNLQVFIQFCPKNHNVLHVYYDMKLQCVITQYYYVVFTDMVV